MILNGTTKPHPTHVCGGHPDQIKPLIDAVADQFSSDAMTDILDKLSASTALVALQDRHMCNCDRYAMQSAILAHLSIALMGQCIARFRVAHSGTGATGDGKGGEDTHTAMRNLINHFSAWTDEMAVASEGYGPLVIKQEKHEADGKKDLLPEYEQAARVIVTLCEKASRHVSQLYHDAK